MNRLGTAVLAAIEGIVTVGVGLGIALVPLTLLWGFEYGLQVDWDVFWKATGSVWLVGHGVDVSFVLGSALATSSGVAGAADPIHVTIAALGFALVTAWLGGRAGRRFAETEHRVTGLLVGAGVVAVLGLAVALSSTSAATDPSVWQAVVLPALWFTVPAVVTSEVCRRRRGLPADPVTQRVLDLFDRVPAPWRDIAAFGFRAGTAATAVVVTVAGVLVGFLLLGSFAEVITLYERSHAGLVGGIAMTVGQLAFVPDLVAWATAWLVGPGFAIGAGSSVSPIGTTLGPIPGIPLFGALPSSGHTFGLVWVLVPVVAGFVAGGLLRPRLVRALGARDTALHRALGGVAAGVVAGLLTGGIAWISSGSLGPGRLAEVGPHAVTVGALAALEVGVPAALALAVGSDLVRFPDRPLFRERWTESSDTAPVDTEGSLLAALDQAGAGRTTDVHRFVVEEAHDGATHGSDGRSGLPRAASGAATEPIADGDHPAEPAHEDGPADTTLGADTAPAPDPDADVELPEWARTDVVAAERVEPAAPGPSRARVGGIGALRDRLRGAADGVRDRAGELRDRAGGLRDRAGDLRDRVTGADVERPGFSEERAAPESAPDRHETVQPAFPWSTEEFVAGRDDDTEESVPDEATTGPSTSSAPGWDSTDQIPEDELPWWRRPKSGE